MIEHVTSVRTANAIIQDTTFNGHYLLVEGNNDYKVYSKFFDEEKTRIKEAWGYERVKETLDILEERDFERRLGIIDSDFSEILKIEHNNENLFITDYHDIEVMMVKSSALESVANIIVKKEKLKSFLGDASLEDILLKVSKNIGVLKLANNQHSLGLLFKPEKPDGRPLKYKEFISENDLTFLGMDKLIQTALNYSNNRGTDLKNIEEIKNCVKEYNIDEYPTEHLVNGHDLTNIMQMFFKKTLKSNHTLLKDNNIENYLILSYTKDDFKRTRLFQSLKAWVLSNKTDLLKKELLE